MPTKPKIVRRSWQQAPKPMEDRAYKNDRYHTPLWRKLRKQILLNEPLCRNCAKDKLVTIASVVDHIKPVSSGNDEAERDSLHWDEGNLQPLCTSCHNSKSSKEGKKH